MPPALPAPELKQRALSSATTPARSISAPEPNKKLESVPPAIAPGILSPARARGLGSACPDHLAYLLKRGDVDVAELSLVVGADVN